MATLSERTTGLTSAESQCAHARREVGGPTSLTRTRLNRGNVTPGLTGDARDLTIGVIIRRQRPFPREYERTPMAGTATPRLSIAVALLLSIAGVSHAQVSGIDLGTLGGSTSSPRRITDRGQVVGESRTASGESHAFLWTLETGMLDLGLLTAGGWSQAAWVNAENQVVGASRSATGFSHAYIWTAGNGMTDLGTLGGRMSVANFIDDHGRVFGVSEKTLNMMSLFVWTADAGMTDLGDVGPILAAGISDVNSQGQVAGSGFGSNGSSITHAFRWTRDAGIVDLGALGGSWSRAVDIDEIGRVVGNSALTVGSAQQHAFLWTDEQGMIDLGTLGGTSSGALKIMDGGAVLGWSDIAGDTARHLFSWTAATGIVDLGGLHGGGLIATGANDVGQVVGSYGLGPQMGFAWNAPGSFQTLLPVPIEGRSTSRAIYINRHGHAVGVSDYAPDTLEELNTRATLWITAPASQAAIDIGDVGVAGSSEIDGETVFIRGSGADIWSTADAFHWKYEVVNGDFDVVALVTNVEHVHDWTKAGLMIRQDLSSESAHMFVFATPSSINGVAFQRRLAPGAATLHTGGPAIAAPVYLRLSRRGPAVSAWYRRASTDQWTFIGTDYTQALGERVLVGQAVTSHQYGLAATATFEGVSITAPLPVGSVDIGDVGAPGSASTAPGSPDVITVRGSGADIWGPEDAFHVHWSPTTVPRDFDAVVRVLSVEAVDAWTKAGLMIRSGSGATAVHTSLFATGNNGLAFQRRVASAASSTHTAGPALQAPVWLKLSRRGPGTVFASYREHVTDPWTLIGSDRSNSFGPELMIGLAVTSHVKGQLATAMFERLSIAPVPQFASLDIGNVTAQGTTSSDALVTQLSSAGADIWGSADAFRFHHSPIRGDAEIVVRVLALDPTDPWAKAGVMFRQGPTADSPYVFAFFSAARGISLQYRDAVGGTSAQVMNVPGAPPGWLRLRRNDNVFTAEYSLDSLVWSALGSVHVPMNEIIAVGLALTSHNESKVTSAWFDEVSARNLTTP